MDLSDLKEELKVLHPSVDVDWIYDDTGDFSRFRNPRGFFISEVRRAAKDGTHRLGTRPAVTPQSEKLAQAEARMRLQREISLAWTELKYEIVMELHAAKITFAEAAQWIEAKSANSHPWVRQQAFALARSWRSQGHTTFRGQKLNREAEIPAGGDFARMLEE